MTIGERIKEKRLEKNMSLDDLAKSASVKRQTIYKYENNIISNIPIHRVRAIAKVLNVSVPYLMGWETEHIIYEDGSEGERITSSPIVINLLDSQKFRIPLEELISMVEELDDYGIDLVTTVIEKEFERCSELHKKDPND